METKGRRPSRAAVPSTTSIEPAPRLEAQSAEAESIDNPVEEVAPVAAPQASSPDKVSAGAATSTLPDDLGDFGREAFAALVQSQTALARGLEALSTEMAGLALSGINAAARTATEMLGIKTLSDAIEVNAGLTRSSLVAMVGGSAKLSELGVKLAAEASQPILAQLGKSWVRAARFAF